MKGSKYQTLPGKLPRPLQNGDQGAYNSPDGSGTNGSEDSSIPGLSTYRGGCRRGKGKLLEGWGGNDVVCHLLCQNNGLSCSRDSVRESSTFFFF